MTGPDGLFVDETGFSEQSQMTGDRWPADRKLVGDLMDCPVALAEDGKDLPAVTVSKGIESGRLTGQRCTSEWRGSVTLRLR